MAPRLTPSRPSVWGRRGRLLLLWVVAVLGLALLSGRQMWRPSRDNHFVVMAQGWLDGRLSLVGKPPGWCDARSRAQGRCRGHQFDDWAVVWTLHTADGQQLRGYPCRTEACAQQRRVDGSERWWLLGKGWTSFGRGEIVRKTDTWYVSFPPGPAAVLLPFVAIWGLRTADVLITLLFGALIPVVMVMMLDRVRGVEQGRGQEHWWVAFAWTFGSPATLLAANGRVWFTAQILGALFLMLYLAAAWNARRPALAGLCLGLAVACRPINHLPAIIVFLWFWWRGRRDLPSLLRFALPLGLIGLALAGYNVVRFSDPLEFGHRFLEIRWQGRMQEFGMFHWHYLPRNIQCLLTLMPQLQPQFPWFRVSIHGMALWLSSPWIALAPWARQRFEGRGALWSTIALSALPSLLYQNSGQLQLSYRFAVDWIGPLLLALALGGAVRRRAFKGLAIVAAIMHCVGAWYFARTPGRVFVADPPGWPFSGEFDSR